MNLDQNTQLSLAAVVLSACALFVSLFTAFPGLKDLLAAVRDGVLWFALFVILGGCGFVVYQHLGKLPKTTAASPLTGGSSLPALAFPSSAGDKPSGITDSTPTERFSPTTAPLESSSNQRPQRYDVGPVTDRAQFEATNYGLPAAPPSPPPAVAPPPSARAGVTPVPFPDRQQP